MSVGVLLWCGYMCASALVCLGTYRYVVLRGCMLVTLYLIFCLIFKLDGEAGEPTFRRLVLRSVAHVIRLYSSSLVTESEVLFCLQNLFYISVCSLFLLCMHYFLQNIGLFIPLSPWLHRHCSKGTTFASNAFINAIFTFIMRTQFQGSCVCV